MDRRIAEYIAANRARYTRDAIRQQLIDAGYPPAEIDSTWAALDTPDPDSTAGSGFWGRFWIYLIAANVAVFLLVGLLTGILTNLSASGGGSVMLAILAVALGIGALIAWAIVAATGPTRLGRGTAMAIGGIIPLIFALLIGGSCFALVGSLGPPARSGFVELTLDAPNELVGSGSATCFLSGGGGGFSVFAAEVGPGDGTSVNANVDAFVNPDGEWEPNLFITIVNPSEPERPITYFSMPETTMELQVSDDGRSGTLTFDDIPPEGGELPSNDPAGEPISGSITWTCD